MMLNFAKYHTILAYYFSYLPLYIDGDQQKKPHIRKCMEQPFQQTNAQLWDAVTDTLTNIEFIEAKACAKMTYDLVKDYRFLLKSIPIVEADISNENGWICRNCWIIGKLFENSKHNH